MGAYVNSGNLSFQDVRESKIYVDKTGLLEYTNEMLNTEQRYICNSRPRRFGKTITAEMLAAYYGKGCDSRVLFEGLKISKSDSFEKHLNQYDVIHLDMADIRSENTDCIDIVDYIHREVIKELKTYYPGVIEEDDRTLQSALFRIHEQTGARFVVIIDEWDDIFRQEKQNISAQKAYVELLRALFKGEHSRRFLSLVYVTGIYPIGKYNSESALDNFDEFTMLDSDLLAEYIGFTEAEVIDLCRKYQMDFSEMKHWYDGYCLDDEAHVYNPKCVIDTILYEEIGNYWTETSEHEILENYIRMDSDGAKNIILQLFAGERYPVGYWCKDDMLQQLVHLGYLTYDRKMKEVYIPNEEVRVAYRNVIKYFEGSLFETTADPDPFYSESNIRYLEKKMEDYKAGRLKLAEHE